MAFRYKAICIGGVADGAVVERDEPSITIDKKARDKNNEEFVVGKTDYRFLILLATPHTEIGVWAPQNTPLEQIVHRLVAMYNPNTGLIGAPKSNVLPLRAQ